MTREQIEPTRRLRGHAAALLLLAAVLCSGCAGKSNAWKFASWDVRKAKWWSNEPEKPEPQVPVRMVATWADTTLTKVGEKPQRGFGGRLAFFGRESDDPVRVEGDLVVYAFDETSRPEHETHPTRKYIFPMDEFIRHESESKLGPSYSFWLPWDEVGGPQRKISLIARFQPKEGPIVLSEQTRHLLPGTTEVKDGPLMAAGERSALVDSVRLAAYSGLAAEAAATAPLHKPSNAAAAVAQAGEAKPKMTTATIALPPRLGKTVQQPVDAIDARATSTLPLSQLAALQSGPSGGAAEADEKGVHESAAASPANASAPAAARVASARTSQATAARRAASGSLRDSLLETLPAQARQVDQRAPARAQ